MPLEHSLRQTPIEVKLRYEADFICQTPCICFDYQWFSWREWSFSKAEQFRASNDCGKRLQQGADRHRVTRPNIDWPFYQAVK